MVINQAVSTSANSMRKAVQAAQQMNVKRVEQDKGNGVPVKDDKAKVIVPDNNDKGKVVVPVEQ